MTLSEHDYQTLSDINITLSVFSGLAAAFVIATYLTFTKLRTFAFTLVFNLAISDFGFSVGGLMGNVEQGPACVMQAHVLSIFGTASVLWTSTMAYTLYVAIIKTDDRTSLDIQNMLKYFHVYAWGSSIFLSLLPYTTESYGDSGGWCWIRNDINKAAGNTWRFIQFYIPLFAVIGFNTYVYLKTRATLALLRDASLSPESPSSPADRVRDESSSERLSRIQYYPLALIILFFFATINRIYEIFGEPVMWLSTLHLIGQGCQGIVNASIYAFTPTVSRAVKKELLLLPCFAAGGRFDGWISTSNMGSSGRSMQRQASKDRSMDEVNHTQLHDVDIEDEEQGDLPPAVVDGRL